jgi:hypothetical protein
MTTFVVGCSRNWTQLRSPSERPRPLTIAFGCALILSLIAPSASNAMESVDLATVARDWTVDYVVRGSKTEPTFVEHLEYARRGDRFWLRGDVDGEDLGMQVRDLAPDGAISVAACPPGTACDETPPNGFLSTMAVLAALRSGRLTGDGDAITYAGRKGVCIPLEAVQPGLEPASVVLDPCLDLQTGALLAERRRFDAQFGGAMLDESSFVLTLS